MSFFFEKSKKYLARILPNQSSDYFKGILTHDPTKPNMNEYRPFKPKTFAFFIVWDGNEHSELELSKTNGYP